jgi:hypothetical protein
MAWLPTPVEAGELDRLSKNFYGVIQAFGPHSIPHETGPKVLESTPSKIDLESLSTRTLSKQLSSNPDFSLIHWNETGLIAMACHWLPSKNKVSDANGVLLLRLLNLTENTLTTQLRSDLSFTQVTPVNLLNEPIANSQSFVKSITLESKQLQTFLIGR